LTDDEETDDEDVEFIKEFDESLRAECGANIQAASVKTAVEGIRRIAKVRTAEIYFRSLKQSRFTLHDLCNAEIVFSHVFK
jgi:hypothetical protein